MAAGRATSSARINKRSRNAAPSPVGIQKAGRARSQRASHLPYTSHYTLYSYKRKHGNATAGCSARLGCSGRRGGDGPDRRARAHLTIQPQTRITRCPPLRGRWPPHTRTCTGARSRSVCGWESSILSLSEMLMKGKTGRQDKSACAEAGSLALAVRGSPSHRFSCSDSSGRPWCSPWPT